MCVKVIIQTHFQNFKWTDKRLGLGSLAQRGGGIGGRGGESAPLIKRSRNPAAGFQTFCHFQVDVCLQQIPASSRPGRSVAVSPVFMLKGPCDGISIHDHGGGRRAGLPAFPDLQHAPSESPHRRLCSSITPETGLHGDTGSCSRRNLPVLIKTNFQPSWNWSGNPDVWRAWAAN